MAFHNHPDVFCPHSSSSLSSSSRPLGFMGIIGGLNWTILLVLGSKDKVKGLCDKNWDLG